MSASGSASSPSGFASESALGTSSLPGPPTPPPSVAWAAGPSPLHPYRPPKRRWPQHGAGGRGP
eukprot:3327795-Alexandrium_andersonii.AAC.1